MWFKNLKVYRLSQAFKPTNGDLAYGLSAKQFKPCGSLDMQSIGWVSPCEGWGLTYAQGEQYLLALRSEKKVLPASVVNQATAARALEIEDQQGFKPGRKQTKEIREQIIDELLPKAFTTYRDTKVWLDLRNHWLVIDTGSNGSCDEVLGMLAKSIEPFPVSPLFVQQSPAAAMTRWLLDDEAPADLSIDQDTELASTSASGAKVKYVRQSVDVEDARKHVQSGKQCTRLAMTWADRVSFVLTDDLDIKRIVPLDVYQDGMDTMQNAAERFDSNFALMTGELNKLLCSMVDALGGERPQADDLV